MPLTSSDIVLRLSGGESNNNPLLSLGGVLSSVVATASFFNDINAADALSGKTEYRCLYIVNTHTTLTALSPLIWMFQNTPSPDTSIEIGLGTSAVNAQEQTVANITTAPIGVSFTTTADIVNGLSIPDIPAGQFKAIWIKRIVNPNSVTANDSFKLRIRCSTNS